MSLAGKITGCFSLIREQSPIAGHCFAVSYQAALKEAFSLDVTWVI